MTGAMCFEVSHYMFQCMKYTCPFSLKFCCEDQCLRVIGYTPHDCGGRSSQLNEAASAQFHSTDDKVLPLMQSEQTISEDTETTDSANSPPSEFLDIFAEDLINFAEPDEVSLQPNIDSSNSSAQLRFFRIIPKRSDTFGRVSPVQDVQNTPSIFDDLILSNTCPDDFKKSHFSVIPEPSMNPAVPRSANSSRPLLDEEKNLEENYMLSVHLRKEKLRIAELIGGYYSSRSTRSGSDSSTIIKLTTYSFPMLFLKYANDIIEVTVTFRCHRLGTAAASS